MIQGINRVHHMNFLDNNLPDGCANVVYADPPYFEVKGDFDYKWATFEDYLKDVEKWTIECKRILAPNGTLFWWGNSKKIAYSQIILDKYFHLENSMVWRKKDSIQYQYYSPDLARSFNTHNERVLMYSNSSIDEIGRNYFKYIQKELNLPAKAFLNKVGSTADHCFRWGSTQWDLPTEETYNSLIKAFGIDLLKGFIPYEDLRRPFHNSFKYEEVLEFSQEGHITRQYDHDTKKPETLTRALILTCSRPNDLVVVPFAGSGTEHAMAIKEGRRSIAFDIEKKYVDMSNKRAEVHLRQPALFC